MRQYLGMTGLPRLAWGTAVLTAERLVGRTSPNSPVAIAVGLAAQGSQGTKKLLSRAAEAVQQASPPSLKKLQGLVHDAGARGAIAMSRSRRDAEATLRSVRDGSVSWAETVAGRYAPRFIDVVLPPIRARVLPVLVDDLSTDPKVRAMISEQSQSVIIEATDELRLTSADADDRIESVFRRLFRTERGL